jgi:hypothetical protein
MRCFITYATLAAALIGIQPMLAMAKHPHYRGWPSHAGKSWQVGVSFQNPAFQFQYGTPQFQYGTPQLVGSQYQSGYSPIGSSQYDYGYPQIGGPAVGYAPEQLEGFIREWYKTYLGREPEPAAYAMWVNNIYNGGTLGEAEVGIMSSVEAFNRCQNDPETYVASLIRQVAGREATQQEVQTWTGLFFQRYHGDRSGLCRDLLISLGRY